MSGFSGSASAPASRDYTTFLHLMTPAAVSSGQPLAAADAQPGGGSCNTSGWRPGEIIVDELQFVAPEAAQPGPYTLEVGMYDLATGDARPRADGQGDVAILAPTVAGAGQ